MPYSRPPDQRRPREYTPLYLDHIRRQPCCICGNDINVEAAHVRFGVPADGKAPTGMGEKPDDRWAVPLCGRHHREQHAMNEREFWASYHIDPLKLCLKYQVMVT